MPTATNTYLLDIPQADMTFMRQLAKRMGWKMRSAKPTNRTATKQKGLDAAIADLEQGRVYKATDSADMLQQILG